MTDHLTKTLAALVRRYRHELPLGNQPHMIAQDADEALALFDAAQQEAGEQAMPPLPEPDDFISVVTAGGEDGEAAVWREGKVLAYARAAQAAQPAPEAAKLVALPDPPAFPILASMAEQVRHAIDLHSEGASTAQAIGVLEIVKQQLIQEQA